MSVIVRSNSREPPVILSIPFNWKTTCYPPLKPTAAVIRHIERNLDFLLPQTCRYVEDVAELLLLALQHLPQAVARTVDQCVMTWLLTLVCSAHCFNNPYLVAKLVEVLFMMNPVVQVNAASVLLQVLDRFRYGFVWVNLLPATFARELFF